MSADSEPKLEISINQLGYKPDMPKKFMIKGNLSSPLQFTVYKLEGTNRQQHCQGITAEPFIDRDSGDIVYQGDFSEVKQPGKYVLAAGDEESSVFEIVDDVYTSLSDALLKSYYFQRCGTALKEEYAGPWAHPCCHQNDGRLWEEPDTHLDVSGGWHDAGDYGKYSTPGAVTAGQLLLAYELFPGAFERSINIPESEQPLPDILSEVRYQLEWLLKMQREDGGVYHKVTPKEFVGFERAEELTEARYIFEVSPTATGNFAAVMARAARIYSKFDTSFSQLILNKARQAGNWLLENPEAAHFENPPGVITGAYGDHSARDERFWAAVELYRTTGEKQYHNYLKIPVGLGVHTSMGLGWQDVAGLGVLSYLLLEEEKRDHDIYQQLEDDFLKKSKEICQLVENSGYNVALAADDYYWGSNGLLMNRAVLLVMAYLLQDKEKYRQLAAEQLHYLLGRNSLGQCFVTGFGERPVKHPHHRPSAAYDNEEPVPGLVAGGPNRYFQDYLINEKIAPGTAPACVYLDHKDSYSTNEVAIYWNSPAVFVAAYFDNI